MECKAQLRGQMTPSRVSAALSVPDCVAQLALVAGSLAVWRGGGSALQWHCCAVCHSRLFADQFDPDSPATVMRKVGMPAVGMPSPDPARSNGSSVWLVCIVNYNQPSFCFSALEHTLLLCHATRHISIGDIIPLSNS